MGFSSVAQKLFFMYNESKESIILLKKINRYNMADTETNVQTSLTEAVESKTQEAAQATTTKATEAKDSIVNNAKKAGVGIMAHLKILPKAQKVKLFLGLGFIVISFPLLIEVAFDEFIFSKVTYILFAVFYPVIMASTLIVSAYNQSDFFEALFGEKKKKVVEPTPPVIHSEEKIHETHHEEIENDEG